MTNAWSFVGGRQMSAGKKQKGPDCPGLFTELVSDYDAGIGRPIDGATATERSGGFLFHHRFVFRRRFGSGLRTTMRTLRKRRFDLLDRLGLGQALHGGNLTRQPIEGCFVQLPLRVRLLRLRLRTIKITHDLGDLNDVARIDLLLVFLCPARPHGALDACAALERLERPLDHRRLGQLAHADGRDLGGRNAERHLVFDEVDHEQLKPRTGDLLLLDGHDLAHTVSRIHDEFIRLEALPLRSLLRGHSQTCSFRFRLAPGSGLCRASDPGAGRPRGLSWPSACAGGGFPCLATHSLAACAGRALLRTMTTSFLCHSSRVGLTPLLTIPRNPPYRTGLTNRESTSGVCFITRRLYNTFSAKIKALWQHKSVAPAERVKAVKTKEKTPFISRQFRDSAKNTFQTCR